MAVLLRPLANLLAVVLALTLLVILLLVSSGGDDNRQRLLDQNLRELREIGTAIQSEVVTADSLELDISNRFRTFEAALDAVSEQLEQVAQELETSDSSIVQRARGVAVGLFNSIDPQARDRLGWDELELRLNGLWTEVERLRNDADAFSQAQRAYLSDLNAIQEQGRDLVTQMRQGGHTASADAAFATFQQAIERIRRAGPETAGAVTTTLERLGEVSVADADLESGLEQLADGVSALLDRRLELTAHISRLTASQLPDMVEDLRESVSTAYLFSLRTVGEARVLLNIYTAIMLLVMVYMGVRLQANHRLLNRSHGMLEERVKARTQELESAYLDLKESQVQLVQAEKMSSLGQLVAGLVHEINTPLQYVANNTAMTRETITDVERDLKPLRQLVGALREPEVPRDKVRALLAQLRSSMDIEGLEENLTEVTHLTSDSIEGLEDIDQLVKSLKDFSRLDRQQFDHFDVRDGLEKTLLITKNMLKYGIDVERDFQEVPEILCAPSRINQVFINLVTNAAQAMDGKGKLGIRTFSEVDGWVHIAISDTGCGIPQENIDKVLDPFFTTKPVGQGTGLGLSIVRKIIDEHGGELDIESEEGVGTTITLILPCRGAEAGTETLIEETEAA